MRQPSVPVTLGSPRFRSLDAGGVRVTEAWFPPVTVLEPHIHDRPILCAMLDGSFDVAFPGRRFACSGGVAHIEPLGERHANYVGTAGARVVVVQPDPADEAVMRPLRGALDAVTSRRDPALAARARRIAVELATPDDVSPLAVSAYALDMLALTARRHAPERGRPPAWLPRAEEYLRAHARNRIQLADVARASGVHPAHLTRTFQRHYHMTVATYVRSLRLEWAAARLRATSSPLATIALEAGFTDQSHFTRWFRGWAGTTPGRFRAATRPQTRTPPGHPDGV